MTHNRLVLIVDDSAPLRSAMRELIDGSMLACSCAEASTGEEAIALVGEIGPEVVIMDLKLPGMNGIMATRRIKAMLPQVKIVMVSLFEAAHFQAEAVAAGAVAFLPKRVMRSELIPLLARLLESPKGEPTRPADEPRTEGAGK